MLFASFDFLLFFAVAFAGYWALAGRPVWRAVWIVGASYFFYMAAAKPVSGPLPTPWYFVGLLILTTGIDYFCALRISAAQERSRGADAASQAEATEGLVPSAASRPGKPWLLVSVLSALGLLGYFKYTGFLFEVVSDTAALIGADAAVPAFKVLLPVGISFYTFESLSYTIDVYRGRITAEKNFLRFAVFLAFFPKLVAGPIMRAGDFLPQLERRLALTRQDVDFALFRITRGLVKKMLFADFIAASFADRVFAAPLEHSSLENLLALYAFTLQIYADFSGYSDIAIGTGRLLGLRITENFNRPYQAVDIADFWRRWHITLSTWLRDYVYYPLGGNRKGELRNYANLWLTMFLVGIWHGASWNFVIYANVQAGAMLYNRFCRRSVRPQDGDRKRDRQPTFFVERVVRLGALSVAVTLATALLGFVGLKIDDPWTFGLGGGALALFIGLLPKVEEWPVLRPVHVLLTLHFSVLSRVFFRSDTLESARTMAEKLVHWDGLGVRHGLFGNEALSAWLNGVPALSWARPLVDWSVLLLMLAGFALHYTPARKVEETAERLIARTPAVAVGMGFAVLLGVLSLLLAGPRANIYFAF